MNVYDMISAYLSNVFENRRRKKRGKKKRGGGGEEKEEKKKKKKKEDGEGKKKKKKKRKKKSEKPLDDLIEKGNHRNPLLLLHNQAAKVYLVTHAIKAESIVTSMMP